ncbi:MAG: hypothetical protein IJE22_01665 [Oscillibacter sp.]|nr:hypothetical protein [Oscillibacter sp.]
MEDKRITDLAEAAAITKTDLFVAEQDGSAVKVTAEKIAEYVINSLPNGDEVSY